MLCAALGGTRAFLGKDEKCGQRARSLGQSQGPRFGGFIALYGVKESAQLVRDSLARV